MTPDESSRQHEVYKKWTLGESESVFQSWLISYLKYDVETNSAHHRSNYYNSSHILELLREMYNTNDIKQGLAHC